MEYMHDTLHLPWLWVIPLSALTIRILLYHPITLSTRLALQRRLAISPLISAYKPSMRQQARILARQNPEKNMQQHHKALMKGVTDELKVRYACGLGRTFFGPMVQFPVFLGVSWTIRDMLGMEGGGLKALICTMLGYDKDTASSISTSTSAGTIAQAAAAATGTTTTQALPTMTTEGLPWALDLTTADPTGTLSYLVSAIMLSQTLLGMRSLPSGARSNTLSRILIVFSLMIGPLMASAPAGILYYWACSSGLALGVNAWLDWRYPLRRVVGCRGPVLRGGLPPRVPARDVGKG